MGKRKRPNSGIIRAIEVAGSQGKLANLMRERFGGKVQQPHVAYWVKNRCPVDRAVEIEFVTGVSRREICPEFFEEPTHEQRAEGSEETEKPIDGEKTCLRVEETEEQ